MIVQCENCKVWFEDVYRSYVCPHRAFPANDGQNNFQVHEDSYLSTQAPTGTRYFLFFDGGGCNDGDHDVVFEAYETEEAAKAAAREWIKRKYDSRWFIVKGERVICEL